MLKVAVFTAVIVYRLHSRDKNENEPLLSGAQVPELEGEVWRNNFTDFVLKAQTASKQINNIF